MESEFYWTLREQNLNNKNYNLVFRDGKFVLWGMFGGIVHSAGDLMFYE